jgi:hypothetical protein
VFSPLQFSQGIGESAFDIERSASKRELQSVQVYSYIGMIPMQDKIIGLAKKFDSKR